MALKQYLSNGGRLQMSSAPSVPVGGMWWNDIYRFKDTVYVPLPDVTRNDKHAGRQNNRKIANYRILGGFRGFLRVIKPLFFSHFIVYTFYSLMIQTKNVLFNHFKNARDKYIRRKRSIHPSPKNGNHSVTTEQHPSPPPPCCECCWSSALFAVRLAGQTVMSCVAVGPSSEQASLGTIWTLLWRLTAAERVMWEYDWWISAHSLPFARKMTLKVWKMSNDTVFSWIRLRGSGKMGSSLLAACAVFRQTSLKGTSTHAGGIPINPRCPGKRLFTGCIIVRCSSRCTRVERGDAMQPARRIAWHLYPHNSSTSYIGTRKSM